MADPTFDEIDGEMGTAPSFDALDGDTVDEKTGAFTPAGATAPVNVASYTGPQSVKTLPMDKPFGADATAGMMPGTQSTGSPAQSLLSKAKEYGGRALDAVQEESGKPFKEMAANTHLPPGLVTLGARVAGANPFVRQSDKDAFFDSEVGQAGGRQIQQKARDFTEQPGPLQLLSPQGRENVADVMSGVLQVGAEVAPQSTLPLPGFNAAGKAAKFVPVLGKASPKLAAFILGAGEARVMMPVYGALGAETDEQRQAVLDDLLNPQNLTWDKAAFMALGGIGGAHANAQHRQAEHREAGAKMAESVIQLGREAQVRHEAMLDDRAASTERRVKAIISEEKMGQLANDLEQKAAMERGEVITPTEKPALDYEQNPPPRVTEADPVNAAYEQAVIPARESIFNKAKAGEASGAARRSSWLKEVPPEFPAQVAVTEAPAAGKGVRAVIQWVGYGTEPRLETFDLHSYDDAKAFRKSLDKSGVKAEVAFSDKAKKALWQKNDPLLNDLLMFSDKELKEGKRGAEVKNRTAALVASDTDAPHIVSLSSHKVKAQAAEDNGAVLVGTKAGPRWALYRGTDSVTGEHLFIPADPSLGDTVAKVLTVPPANVHSYVYKPESWEYERYFRDRHMPLGADKLHPIGEPLPVKVTVKKKVMRDDTFINPTRVDLSFPKGRRAAMSEAAAAEVAASPIGQTYGFEPGGHQGTVAGAGGTKKGNLLMKEGAKPAGAGGGNNGGRPPGAAMGPEPIPFPEKKPLLTDFPETVLDNAAGMEKLFKPDNFAWLRRSLKLVIGEHLSAPMRLQSNIAMGISASQMERVKGDWITAQKKAGLSVNNRAMDLALEEVGKGNMSLDKFLDTHFSGPEMFPARQQVKSVVESMMHRSTELHNELVKRGIVNPRDEMFSESGAKRYFARTTMAFMLKPGEWLKVVEKDANVWAAAQNYLLKQNPAHGMGDVDMTMREMLNNEDPEAAFFADPRFGKAAAHVKQRKQMPPELKALFGQLLRDPQTNKLTGGVSGVYGFAETLAAQEVLYHRALVNEEIAAKPEYALHSLPEGVDTTGEGPYKGWSRMPDNKPQYGKLAGMVVHPAVKDALVHLPAMHERGTTTALGRVLKEFSAVTKGNETALGSASYYANNILGGVQHMMMAGIAPWELGGVPGAKTSMASNFRLVSQGLAEYATNPRADSPGAQFVRDAMRVGADVSGFGAVEIAHDAVNDLHQEIAKQVLGDKNSNAIDLMAGVVKAYKGFRKFQGQAGHMGDAIDRYWRLTTFASLTDKNLARMGVDEAHPATPQQKEDALREAARTVAESFPMPDRLGVIPDQMRRYTGMFAPYLTYRAEVLRNYAMLPGRILKDKSIAVNLAAWGVTLYGLKKGLDALDPVSDDLLKKERHRFSDTVNKYRPAMVYAHMTGKDGRPVYFDLTPIFEPLRYLQGPADHPLLNIGVGALSSVTEGGALERYTQQLAGASAPNMAREVSKRKDWNTGALATIDMAWNDWGLLPKAPQRLYQEYASTLPQPSLPVESYSQQDPRVAVGRALGANLVRQPEEGRAGLNKERDVQQFATDLKNIASRKEGGAVPGRGLVQGLLGNTKKQDMKETTKRFQERMKNK